MCVCGERERMRMRERLHRPERQINETHNIYEREMNERQDKGTRRHKQKRGDTGHAAKEKQRRREQTERHIQRQRRHGGKKYKKPKRKVQRVQVCGGGGAGMCVQAREGERREETEREETEKVTASQTTFDRREIMHETRVSSPTTHHPP